MKASIECKRYTNHLLQISAQACEHENGIIYVAVWIEVKHYSARYYECIITFDTL